MERAFTLLIAGFIFLAPPVLVLLSRQVHRWQKALWALGTAVPIFVSVAGALLGFVTNPHGDPVLLFALLSWPIYWVFWRRFSAKRGTNPHATTPS